MPNDQIRFVCSDGEVCLWEVSEVLYFKGAGATTFAYKLPNVEKRINKPITEIVPELPDVFVHCHLNYVINSSKMETVRGNIGNETLVLEGNIEIPLNPDFSDGINNMLDGHQRDTD